jgi:ribonucleoside-diphosphate reductase subunit M1
MLCTIWPPSFISNVKYDFQKLHDVTKVVAFTLNRIIDMNYYAIPEARRSKVSQMPLCAYTCRSIHLP